jgi:hypothetical protein
MANTTDDDQTEMVAKNISRSLFDPGQLNIHSTYRLNLDMCSLQLHGYAVFVECLKLKLQDHRGPRFKCQFCDYLVR